MSAESIGVGRSVRLDGDVWLIERIVAGIVHLLYDGQYRALPLADLIARREPLTAIENNVDADELWLASQPPAVIRSALEKLAHLNEAATGYRLRPRWPGRAR